MSRGQLRKQFDHGSKSDRPAAWKNQGFLGRYSTIGHSHAEPVEVGGSGPSVASYSAVSPTVRWPQQPDALIGRLGHRGRPALRARVGQSKQRRLESWDMLALIGREGTRARMRTE